jgi:hypothetical protein
MTVRGVPPHRGSVMAAAALLIIALSGALPSLAGASGGPTGSLGRAAGSFASPDTELSGISCWSPTGCMAVGTSTDAEHANRTLAEIWNGKAWRIAPTFNRGSGHLDNTLLAVSCSSADSCSAVGNFSRVPLAEQWNGTAWSLVRMPLPSGDRDASLNSVSCAGPSNCTAVGNRKENAGVPPETLIAEWNGLEWSVVTSPDVPGAVLSNLWAVSCRTGSGCTAVGDSFDRFDTETTLVEHGAGSAWAIVSSPGVAGAQSTLQAVDCTSATVCTAAGDAFVDGANSRTTSTLVEREEQDGWVVVPSADRTGTSSDGFGGVSCPAAHECVAAGGSQFSDNDISTLVESGSDAPWTIVPSPDPAPALSDFEAVSCPARADCMAVGVDATDGGPELPLAAQWDGSTWTTVAMPNP